MNETVNKFLLTVDKLKSEIHLQQPRFTYSACGTFTKKKQIQKFIETGYSEHIHQNELDKVCVQHDTDYGDFKDFPRGTAADKILRSTTINIAKNPKYDGYEFGIS